MNATATPKILGVIPARYASTRFPGKMIALLAGKPVVVHTYERARRSKRLSEVVIAADDPRLVEAVESFGVKVVMTRADHQQGTDRVAEVAESSDADIVVNVQGDEPLIDPETIDKTIQPLLDDESVLMATARRRIQDPSEIADSNTVKVVCDAYGRALYFSRCSIPYIREAAEREQASKACYWQHIGLYAYRREFLLKFAQLPMSPLEKLERLEQLRALENGYAIAVVETKYQCIGVDTPEDLERVAALMPGSAQG
jgi:3-deoxy-manno-octulosonate cytidylyltransferase (CMP-KDO synthetase)